MPAWANTPGMVPVPRTPSTGMTFPYRPSGSKTCFLSRAWPAEPNRPALPICSAPMASPMSASPALMAMITVRTAEAPVAHALLTL